jgi:hypothetical protein
LSAATTLRTPSRWPRLPGVGLVALLVTCTSFAQDVGKGGIYSCTDSRGRRLTSDRPIAECLDREQRELNSSGVIKRVLPPSYTAEERARMEAQRKLEEAERARVNEEKRRERALLIRYPNQSAHDKARLEALAQVDDVMEAIRKRIEALKVQRREIDIEMEFYQGDVKKAPPWLQRKVEDNAQQIEVQNRFLSDQIQEKQRLNTRFDDELSKLQTLWKSR